MLLRSQGSVCLLVAYLAAGTVGHLPHAFGDDPPTQVLSSPEWEARIQAALGARGEWEFVDVPLRDVCEAMQEKLGIDVVLDVKAFEDHGIDTSTPVTYSHPDVSNRSFLRLMLSELELTYTMRLGALWITTPEYAESRLATKVYPIGDLLVRDTTLGESLPDYSLLLQAFTGNIAPATWDFMGGPGAIEGMHDSLVILQTSDVHEQVTEFLTAYRAIISNEQRDDDEKQTAFFLGQQEVSAAIRHALDQPFTAEFEDVSLKEVAEFVSEKIGIPILIDTRALEDFGIDTSLPITGKFNETLLRFALARMLNEQELTYIIRDEVILITTPEGCERRMDIGLYPVRDLVEVGDDSCLELLGARFDFESLTSLIESTVAPDSWDSVGGPGGIATLLPVPTIAVAQTQDAHREIAELLANLRAAKKLESGRTVARENVDPAALIVRSYPIYAAYNSPDELAKLVIRASEPGTWDDEAGTFVQGLGASLVVRHNAKAHLQVRKLLAQLGVLYPSHFKGRSRSQGLGGGAAGAQPAAPGGGGFF